jgi:ribosomal protein S12 methylthiotransferase
VKELIVIAQDSTYYGLDLYGGRTLSSLLGELQSVDGIEWIRLMYAYPARFPMNVIGAFQQYPKLCRYLDIPVQHAADNVLKSMRRGTTNRGLRELLTTIKREIPAIALRTTIIVGYPNETDGDFRMLCDFVREQEFSRLGVFTYSQEEGTTAHGLGDPIPQEVKEERKNTVMEIQQKISLARNESLIGGQERVLIDRIEDGHYVGRTERDAPEIDQEVFVTSNRHLRSGSFVRVDITDATEYDLSARAY